MHNEIDNHFKRNDARFNRIEAFIAKSNANRKLDAAERAKHRKLDVAERAHHRMTDRTELLALLKGKA